MRFSILTAAVAIPTLGSIANAQVSEQCVGSGVCYRLNIPESTAQTGSGDIYFSLSGPTTYSWIALGQGSNGMSNANVFVVYTDGNGNVTLSPRHSRGRTMPTYDSNIDAELLSGSGVQNGVMTANVRCGNCQSWQSSGSMDFTASSGGWIHARASGNALGSTNAQQPIRQHDTHGQFTWNFAPAVGGATANPFEDTTLTVGPAATTESGSGINTAAVLWCHGIFASVAFVLLFPLGGILIRLGNFPNLIWVHAGLQLFAWILFVTAFGLGLYYGIIDNYMSEAHPIIGIVLVAMMLFQPLFGWFHHRRFVQTGARSAVTYGHIWIGRIAILLGMINGGLGMQLSGVDTTYIIAYSVFAGFMGAVYIGAIVYGEMMRKRKHTASNRIDEILNDKERTNVRRSSVGP
ncbi:CBD9-like protein [Ophiobolus disseminans]|uniref:CBD9-like protein n=1 Tax=Ophiobolus disseminans TaxID=1469910 RepID=A0A6A7AHV5_9PLEO|nr:CBD9-like protein [Ophiobolus disseminans]